MAVAVTHREFPHSIRFLYQRSVCDFRALRTEFRVQGVRVINPEERVPRSPCRSFGTISSGAGTLRCMIACPSRLQIAKLEKNGRVFASKAEHLIVEVHRSFDVGDRKVRR